MNINCIFKIVLFTMFIFILPASQSSIPAESPSYPADSIHSPTGTANRYLQRQKDNGETEAQQEQSSPMGRTSISVSTDLVTMQVLVTDTKGNVITGLKPENFVVYEDKVKQEITHFEAIEANITTVLLVEYRKYGDYYIDNEFIRQIYSIAEYFARNLRKGDWAGVIGYDMKPIILADFTQNKLEFLDAMRAISFPAMSEHNLFDALMDTFDRTQEIEGKVSIILLSTGLNSFSKHTYEEVLDRCREAHATIYAISLGQWIRARYGEDVAARYMGVAGGFPLTPIDLSMADARLRYFAEYTGGNSYYPRQDGEIPKIINNISALLRSQYSIGYVSTNTKKDGKFRKIKVEVNAKVMVNGKEAKLKVKTREGYKAAEL
ncbi:MAG: VWA domain-containing protein [Acidobacteria bacterium]|nr:VWA domain-containing protein [Acidobacteriota bacterium]